MPVRWHHANLPPSIGSPSLRRGIDAFAYVHRRAHRSVSPGPLHLGPQRLAGGEACAGKWGCVCKPRGVQCGGAGPTLCRFQSAQVCFATALPTFDCHFRPVISDGPHLGRPQLGSSPTRRPHLKPSERSVTFPLCRDLCLSEQSWSAGELVVDSPTWPAAGP